MTEEEKKEHIEHEIIDRLYCMEEKDFNRDTVTQDYIEAVIKAGKEAKELIVQQQKEIQELKENQIWSEATIEGLKTDFIHKDRIREFISKYTKETLKDFSPYIRDNSTSEKERKSGQLRILQKIKKELLEE